jgi:hypothetical protein
MPQGYAYGYNNHGQMRSLHMRLNRLQHRIDRLDSRDRISEREARRLREDARDLERRLHRATRYGLNPHEHGRIEERLQRLEYRLMRDANDGRRWDDRNRYGYPDRDRDGRDDRFERDGGWDRD